MPANQPRALLSPPGLLREDFPRGPRRPQRPRSPWTVLMITVVLVATTLAAALPLAGPAYGIGGAAADRPDYLVDLAADFTAGKALENQTLNYTLTVTNLGQQADSFAFQLGGPGYGLDEVTARVVVPGTATNRLSLDPGESGRAVLLVTISAPKGSYEVAVAALSQADSKVWDAVVTTTTIIPEGSQEYGLQMSVEPPEQAVAPGVPAYYRVKVANTGTVADTVQLTLGGPAYGNSKVKASLILPRLINIAALDGTAKTDGQTALIFLNAGQTAMVVLKVVVEARSGEYILNVTGTSRGDPSVMAEISTTTIIKDSPHYAIELWAPDPAHTTAPGLATDYWMVLANTGAAADAVKLSLSGDLGAGVNARLYLLRDLDPHTAQVIEDQSDRFLDSGWNLTSANTKTNTLEVEEARALVPISDTHWVYLRPGEKVQLILRVIIDIEAKAQYSITVNAQSRGGADDSQETVTTVIVDPRHGLDLAARDPAHKTGRNVPTDYLLTLENTGNVNDRFLVYLTGRHYGAQGVKASLRVVWPTSPADDAAQSPTVKDHRPVAGPEGQYYAPSARDTVTAQLWRDGVVIGLKPGQKAYLLLEVAVDKPAGTYEIAVAGHSLSKPTAKDKVTTYTTLFTPSYGVDLAITDWHHTVQSGQTTRYLISLTNTGNVRDTYGLWLGGPDYPNPAVEARLWLLYTTDPANGQAGSAYDKALIEAGGDIVDPDRANTLAPTDELPGWPDLRVTLNPGQTVSLVLAVRVTGDPGDYGVNLYALSLGGFVLRPALTEAKGAGETDPAATGRSSATRTATLKPLTPGSINPGGVATKADSDAAALDRDLTLIRTYDWVKTLTTVAAEPRYGVDVTISDDHHYILEGGTTAYHLAVTNTGNLPDTVQLTLGGRDYGREGVEANIYLYRLLDAATVDGSGQRAANGDELTLVDRDNNYLATDATSGYVGPLDLDKVFVRLDSGETVRFALRVSVDLGPGAYEVSVTGASRGDASKWDSEQTITTVVPDPSYGVALKGEQTEQTIEQGSTARYLMVVANTGNVADKVTLRVGGPAWGQPGVSAWLSVVRLNSADQHETALLATDGRPLAAAYDQFVPVPDNGKIVVVLNGGQRLAILLTVSISADPDDYELSVTATSGGDPDQSATLTTVTTVIEQPRYGVDLEAGRNEQTVIVGEPARYRLAVTNTGNVRDTVKVALGGPAYGQPGVKASLSLIRVLDAASGKALAAEETLAWANETLIETKAGAYQTKVELGSDDGFYLFLGPGQTARLLLTVEVAADPGPGKYELSVTATSLGDPDQSEAVMTTTKVILEPEYRVDLWVKDPHHYTTYGRPTYYLVGVANLGNVHDTIMLQLGGAHYGSQGVKAQLFFPAWNQAVEQLELEAGDGAYQVLDPAALEGVDSDGTDLTRYVGPIPLAKGLGLQLGPGQSAYVVLRVIVNREADPAPEGYEVDVRGTSKGDPARTDFVSTWTHLYRTALAEKVDSGVIAGAFYLDKGRGEPEIYDEGLTLEPLVVEPQRLRLKVAGNFATARVVVIHLDKERGQSTLANPLVELDGEPLAQRSLDKVLANPSAGGYALVEEANATQAVVAIPSFSDHVLEIRSGGPVTPEPEQWWEVGWSLALFALPLVAMAGALGAVVVLARRPKRRRPAPFTLDDRSGDASLTPTESGQSSPTAQDQWAPLFVFNDDSQWRPKP